MKIRIKFVKSYGTYCIFLGNKNKGSNFVTSKDAIKEAKKKFPSYEIVEVIS